jgi:hypothetical protein
MVVCLQPVAAPAVFEFGLVHPRVKTAPDVLTETFNMHVDKAHLEKIVSKDVDREDNVDATIDGFDQPSQLFDGGRVGREEGRGGKPSSGLEYSMGFGRATGQVLVLGRFHRVTLVERLACVRKFQRGTSLEDKSVGLSCDQLGVGPGGAVDLIL